MLTKIRALNGASAGVLALLMMAPTVACAAEAEAQKPAETQIEELIVTAQRREENAQKVPISMTVLGSEALAQNVRTSDQIAQMVPNIQLTSSTGFGLQRNGIRGVAQGDFNANATTSNMVYIDDLPLDTPISQGVPVWDLGRAEVLRGPQGTLFGRNATGGAIRYISAMPTSEAEGYVDITAGVHGLRELHAAYSAPITDTLRGRIAYVSSDFGGDVNNVIRHVKQGRQEYSGVRGILEWKPTDDLTVVLRAQTYTGNQDILSWKVTPGLTSKTATNFGPLANGYTSVAQIQAAYGFHNYGYSSNYYTSESDIARPNEHIEHTPITLNVDYDFGAATLTSVTGFLNVRHSLIIDNDASPAPFLGEYDRHFSSEYTQELRLTSNNDGAFKWIVGAFYLKEFLKADLDLHATAWKGNEDDLFPTAKTVEYTRGDRNWLETYAVFAHTTYQITPDLMLTAAARYTTEDKRIQYRFRTQWQFPSTAPQTIYESDDFIRAVDSGNRGILLSAANPISATASRSFSKLTWKLALDYRLGDHTMAYGMISRGFKGGAFVPTSNTIGGVLGPDGKVLAVRPEVITDYEAGVKSDLIPGRLRVNGSVFYYDYRDYQTNQLIPALAIQVLSNLPKSELYGAELEVEAIPVDNLTLTLGLGALHTEITKSTDPALIGNRLPLAEDFNYNAAVKYDFHTAIGVITPEISAKYRGNYFGTKENDFELGGYTILNARIGYESPNGKFYGSLWGTNLSDKVVPLVVDDPDEFWGGNNANVSKHRRYGVTIGARF